MQQKRTFGRRGGRSHAVPPAVQKARPGSPVDERGPEPIADEHIRFADDLTHVSASREQELAEWKAARNVRKQSFREPWRSVSIAAGLGFVATSWILPDSVANVAEAALGVLTAGSFYAGWRARKTQQA